LLKKKQPVRSYSEVIGGGVLRLREAELSLCVEDNLEHHNERLNKERFFVKRRLKM
jgi:hypothetical protein